MICRIFFLCLFSPFLFLFCFCCIPTTTNKHRSWICSLGCIFQLLLRKNFWVVASQAKKPCRKKNGAPVYIYPTYLFRPIYYPRTIIALPPSSTSEPGSHSGPSSPLPTVYGTCLHFYREKNSGLFSLAVDSYLSIP